MADGPKLIELIRHIVLHLQVVAGDIPAAAVLRAQGDAPLGNEALHLLGDQRRRLVKRLALDDKLDYDTAKLIITEYRKEKS